MLNISDPIAQLLGPWSAGLGAAAMLFRLVLSFLLSAAIGCERSNKRHSAGLRTFIVVSLGSTVAMLLDLFLAGLLGSGIVVISAATVVAVGIMSTYSILYSSKSQIKGLTTAVALWAGSVVGLAVGAGLYTAALFCFVAVFVTLHFVPGLEK